MIFYFYFIPLLLCLLVMKSKSQKFTSEEVITSIIPVLNIVYLLQMTVGLSDKHYNMVAKVIDSVTNWVNK